MNVQGPAAIGLYNFDDQLFGSVGSLTRAELNVGGDMSAIGVYDEQSVEALDGVTTLIFGNRLEDGCHECVRDDHDQELHLEGRYEHQQRRRQRSIRHEHSSRLGERTRDRVSYAPTTSHCQPRRSGLTAPDTGLRRHVSRSDALRCRRPRDLLSGRELRTW